MLLGQHFLQSLYYLIFILCVYIYLCYHLFPKCLEYVCVFLYPWQCVCARSQTMFVWSVRFHIRAHCNSFLSLALFLSYIKLKENSRRTSQPVSSWCSQTTLIYWLGNKSRYGGIETSVSQCAESLNQTTAFCVMMICVSVPLLDSLWIVWDKKQWHFHVGRAMSRGIFIEYYVSVI